MISLPFYHIIDYHTISEGEFLSLSFKWLLIFSALFCQLLYPTFDNIKERSYKKAKLLYPDENIRLILTVKIYYVVALSIVASTGFSFFILPLYVFLNFDLHNTYSITYSSLGVLAIFAMLFYRCRMVYVLTNKGIRLIIPYSYLHNKDSRFCPYSNIKEVIYSTWPEWVVLKLKDNTFYKDLKGSHNLKKAMEIINQEIKNNEKENTI